MASLSSAYYILTKVKCIPQYIVLPMYKIDGGSTEVASLAVMYIYQIYLDLYSDTDPGDTVSTIKSNTLYWGYVDNSNRGEIASATTNSEGELGFISYDYPSLESYHDYDYSGLIPDGEDVAKDNGYRWIYNGPQEYEIESRARVYDPYKNLTKWKFVLQGRTDYYRHLFEFERNVGDPI